MSAEEKKTPGAFEEVLAWLTEQETRQILGPSTVRQYATSVRRYAEALREGEPTTVEFVLEQLEELSERLKTERDWSDSTLISYRSRVQSALRAYLGQDGVVAEVVAKPKPSRPVRKPRAEGEGSGPRRRRVSRREEGPAPGAARTGVYNLGQGRTLRFDLPDSWSVDDVRKAAWYLMSFAADFNPSRSLRESLFPDGE